MAPPRRGRSRSGPELRGTLGTLLRTTLAQAGAVRDALERTAREGRARIDDARNDRRRVDALADLGEIVLDGIRRGELAELEDVPEIAEAIAAIDELEPRSSGRGDRGDRRGDEPGRDWVAPAARSRFDRGGGGRGDDDAEDGTVSSSGWKPPRPAAQPQRVWRPNAPAPASEPAPAGPPAGRRDRDPSREPGALLREAPGKPRGGIVFGDRAGADRAGNERAGDERAGDEDDDLREYMHPDDVPPKPGS